VASDSCQTLSISSSFEAPARCCDINEALFPSPGCSSCHDQLLHAISASSKHPDFSPKPVFTCAAVDHDDNSQVDDPMDDLEYVYLEVNEVEDPWNAIHNACCLWIIVIFSKEYHQSFTF